MTASERIREARTGNAWTQVDAWLHTAEADWFIDEAVLGGLPEYEADEVLVDFDIIPHRESRRTLALLVNAAISDGR